MRVVERPRQRNRERDRMKYRKKPVVIEAIQWNGTWEQAQEIKDFVGDSYFETTDVDFKRTYNKKYYHHATQWIINEMAFHQRKKKNTPFTTALKVKGRAWKARIGMLIEKQRAN